MPMFLVGNALDADGNVVGVEDNKYVVWFEYTSGGKKVQAPLEVGVAKNINVSAAKDYGFYIMATCVAPEKFAVLAKGAKGETPVTISKPQSAVISVSAPDISASSVARRTYLIQVESQLTPPEPETERLRSFLIGNNVVMGVGVNQVGDAQVDAVLNVTIDGVVIPHNIPMGVPTDVNILNATKVEWVVTPKENIELCIARNGYSNTLLPIVDNTFTWEVPANKIDTANNLDRSLEIRSRVKTKAMFYVGNVLSNGLATGVGGSKFTGTIELTLRSDFSKPQSWSKDSFESTTQEFNVVSGWSEEITMYPYDYGKVNIVPDGDNVITAAIFPSEVDFAGNAIEYNMTATELDPLNLASRNYVVAVNGDSTDPDEDIPPVPVDDQPINNNYLVSRSQLKVFENAVNGVQLNESGFENVYWVKITDYISSIRLLPFKIDESNFDGLSEIKIRKESLSSGTKLKGDQITVNLGTITIPKVHDNTLDYQGVSCELFIPFVAGGIPLDPETVVGYDLQVSMVVNISNGSTTVNVNNAQLQRLISSSLVNIGTDYPFFSQMVVKQIELAPTQAVNGINKAYIKITRPDYNNTRPLARKVGTIGNQKGYIEFDEVQINNISLADEKDMLESALKDGVYIK